MNLTNKARQGIVSLLLITLISSVLVGCKESKPNPLSPPTLIEGTSQTASSDAGEKSDLPNIVFILADDMGYDSVSCLNDKIGNLETPEIDSFAKQGMIFEDGHSASSVCTPTRYGIMTGRYCWRTYLKNTVLWDYATPLISKDRMTIAQMLKDKGYQTGIVGKWHLGMEWPGKNGEKLNALSFKRRGKKEVEEFEAKIDWKGKIVTPRANGFDYYFGDGVPNFPPYCWIENDHMVGTPTVLKPKGMHGRHGIMQEGWTFEQILPKLTEKSVEYIKEAAPKDEPYFLYVPLTSPHTPINPSADFQGKSGVSIYADFVIETDWVVGQIIDAVEASGEADNTLVIFTADNGTSRVANFNELKAGGIDIRAKFRGYKMQIYEGGHRVPLMVRWPKHIKAGTRNNQTVCLNDFFATFAELTGYQIQDNEGEDSYSILPLITGKSETLPGYPAIVHHDYGGQFAIRSKQWKLIIPKNNKGSQLFNMVDDIREQKNIAGQHPEVVSELTAALQKIIDDGRTTKGEAQQNFNGETSWIGTPGNPGPQK